MHTSPSNDPAFTERNWEPILTHVVGAISRVVAHLWIDRISGNGQLLSPILGVRILLLYMHRIAHLLLVRSSSNRAGKWWIDSSWSNVFFLLFLSYSILIFSERFAGIQCLHNIMARVRSRLWSNIANDDRQIDKTNRVDGRRIFCHIFRHFFICNWRVSEHMMMIIFWHFISLQILVKSYSYINLIRQMYFGDKI